MAQLRILSARKAAAASPMYGQFQHRATARVAGAAKPRTLSAKAVMADGRDTRFPPSPSSTNLSSQDAAPRVRVFEKLASTVAINVSQCVSMNMIRERDRGAEALAGKRL